MKSAKYVDDLITEGRTAALDPQALAWEAALSCVGWAYVFGAWGEYCDPSNRRKRARDDHPTIKSACKNFNGQDSRPAGCIGCKWFLGTAESDESVHEGRTRFFDCRGFTYWIIKKAYGFKLEGGGATSQWDTASNWAAKGEIDTMPKNTLCCLFVRKGSKMEHTGLGLNEETIECSSGVQHFTKRNKKWTHWAVPACVTWSVEPTPQPDKKPTLRRGSTGPYVTLAQTELINKGYSCGNKGADGIFGKDTESAVKRFQQDNGLTVDGVIGERTCAALETAEPMKKWTVHIPDISEDEANKLLSEYQGSWKDRV